MGRKRDNASKHWGHLKGVYRKRQTLIYREYLGREDGKSLFGPDVYLCEVTDPPSKLNTEYERVTQVDRDTVNWLLNQYHESPQFQKLAKRTRDDYADYQRLLTGYIMKNGRPFGQAPLAAVKRTTIRGYLDKYGAPIAANRHIQYFKASWNWALERFDNLPDNPCQGVKLNEQTARDRYVNQEEFEAFKETTTGYIPVFMELAYLCRARWSEVAAFTSADVLEEGIQLLRGKGSEGEITAWTPRLRAAVEAAQALNNGAPTQISGAFLIHDKRGKAINQNAFKTSWGRSQRAWEKEGGERFTYHDLKAAGYSDQEEQSAGHKSEKMHKTYNRKLRIVRPAE